MASRRTGYAHSYVDLREMRRRRPHRQITQQQSQTSVLMLRESLLSLSTHNNRQAIDKKCLPGYPILLSCRGITWDLPRAESQTLRLHTERMKISTMSETHRIGNPAGNWIEKNLRAHDLYHCQTTRLRQI